MQRDALIFDVDGTLVDTNAAHVEAWRQAFAASGFAIPTYRIAMEVGQGGDRVVPSILGPALSAEHGATIRGRAGSIYLERLATLPIALFPMVRELFAALRARGIRTALATSSPRRALDAVLALVGLDAAAVADVVVTAEMVPVSKPAPDAILLAVRLLDASAACCAYVGDTPYDILAAKGAGVAAFAVQSGGYSESALRQAGADRVWPGIAQLYDDVIQTVP